VTGDRVAISTMASEPLSTTQMEELVAAIRVDERFELRKYARNSLSLSGLTCLRYGLTCLRYLPFVLTCCSEADLFAVVTRHKGRDGKVHKDCFLGIPLLFLVSSLSPISLVGFRD
jgi:hypothetical protein